MDWSQVAATVVAILTPLMAFVTTAGKKVAEELGKKSGEAIADKAVAMYQLVKSKFQEDDDKKAQRILQKFEENPKAFRSSLAEYIAQKAGVDKHFGEVLELLVQDTRSALFQCLRDKFTNEDLRQIFFRLEIGWNDLIGPEAPRIAKAMSLIEYIETRERLPDLIAVMWEVNPRMNC